MAVVIRFLVRGHGISTIKTTSFESKTERQPESAQTSRSMRQRLIEKQKHAETRWVPTLSAIIEAGDELLFTSELFQYHHDELHLEDLYQAFANRLRTHPFHGRMVSSNKASSFLAEPKKENCLKRRAKLISQRLSSGLTRGVRKMYKRNLSLSAAEDGTKRRRLAKKPAATLISMEKGLVENESQGSANDFWTQIEGRKDGRMFIKSTPVEVAAASIILGSPLLMTAKNDNVEMGAFGILMSMTAVENDGYRVQLQGQMRTVSQHPAQGAGVSTLFAKHLAAGSLPYLQDKEAVHSILFSDEIVETIKSGAPLYIRESDKSTSQSRFLASLPSSRALRFHTLAPSATQVLATPLVDAVAGLPFSSGLAPLASAPLIEAIRFIASGDLAPGRLLQRLEDLVDKVNTHAPCPDVFGPLYKPQNAGFMYRERSRLGKLSNTSAVSDSLADKTARMSRYVTLLQRLMALIPDKQPDQVLMDVRMATKAEFQRSYASALTVFLAQTKSPSLVVLSDSSTTNLKSHCPSTTSASVSNNDSIATKLTSSSTSSPMSASPSQSDLSKHMERILKKQLPLDVPSVAFVARMVVVAWTLSVETVAWKDGERGFRIPNIEELGNNIVLC